MATLTSPLTSLLTSPLTGIAELVCTFRVCQLCSVAALPRTFCRPALWYCSVHASLYCQAYFAGGPDLVRQRARVSQVAQAQRLQVRILHLGSLLPRFLTSSDGKHRFSPVLFDFRYFTDSATAEARIESSRHLQSLDEEMRGVCKLLYDRCFVFGVSPQELSNLT